MATKKITLTLDYETRSEAELKKVGPVKYSLHPSTEIMCMSYKFDDGVTRLWIPGVNEFPDSVLTAFKDENYILSAHNAGFEQAITKNVLPKYFKGV